MCKKFVNLFMIMVMTLSFAACSKVIPGGFVDNSDAIKQEAQVPVDGFMSAFCELDLKDMADYTDATINFADMEYLSMEEFERKFLSYFSVFEMIGLPLDGFEGIIEDIFDAYRDNASYRITNAEIQGNEVVFTVEAEYVELQTLVQILNTSIERIDTDSLSLKIAGSVIFGGFTGKSTEDIIASTVKTVVEELDIAVDRSIAELTPVSTTLTFVVYENNGEWVINDQKSDIGGIAGVFNIN